MKIDKQKLFERLRQIEPRLDDVVRLVIVEDGWFVESFPLEYKTITGDTAPAHRDPILNESRSFLAKSIEEIKDGYKFVPNYDLTATWLIDGLTDKSWWVNTFITFPMQARNTK